MEYRVDVVRKIDEVDFKKWDELVDICFLRVDMLKIVEDLKLGKDSYYLQVFDGDDLVAIAVFYGQKNQSLYDSLDESLYGKYSKYVKSFLGFNPALLCYFPYSPFYKMFEIKKGYNKEELFLLISDELMKIAVEDGYKSYGFLGVDSLDFLNYTSRLLGIFSGFKAKIEIKGKNILEHISKLDKKSDRHTIRKDLKNLEKVPFEVERLSKIDKYESDIMRIFNKNFEKYADDEDKKELITEEYIRAFDLNFDKITYFIGKMNKEIVSASMMIEDDSRVFGLRIGQDDSKGLGRPFFDLAIYEPIAYAAENSLKFVELGTGNYEYKIRRGAVLSSYYNLISSTSRVRNWYLKFVISVLNRRNKKKHLGRVVGGRFEDEV